MVENIYIKFEERSYQQIVWISIGANCTPLIADLFFFCYEKELMSHLHKSKKFYLIDTVCITSDCDTINMFRYVMHL